jgi:glycosyltransferase involved in cell wall biosynthesis
MHLKVLVLAPAPYNISPSQRFRFEHFIGKKNLHNTYFVQKPFFSNATWSVLYEKKHFFRKIIGIIRGFIARFFLLFSIHKYDLVFIHREAAPIGPPVIEWIIAKLLRKKIIYDFDDSIWIKMASESNPMVANLKCSWKVERICRYSHIVSVGNEFLAKYAKAFCKDVRIIPTVVDTELMHNRLKNQHETPLTIGWTGTFTNFHNLEIVIPVLNALKKKYDFRFLIIADKDPLFNNIDYVYKKWSLSSEIEDLLELNIGIMPLKNTEIELGKCAFKAIQYMSLGIPAVVSPVGTNRQVVTDCADGFWVENETEWYTKLEKLITNTDTRFEIGKNARSRIVSNYSVQAIEKVFFDLFKDS